MIIITIIIIISTDVINSFQNKHSLPDCIDDVEMIIFFECIRICFYHSTSLQREKEGWVLQEGKKVERKKGGQKYGKWEIRKRKHQILIFKKQEERTFITFIHAVTSMLLYCYLSLCLV